MLDVEEAFEQTLASFPRPYRDAKGNSWSLQNAAVESGNDKMNGLYVLVIVNSVGGSMNYWSHTVPREDVDRLTLPSRLTGSKRVFEATFNGKVDEESFKVINDNPLTWVARVTRDEDTCWVIVQNQHYTIIRETEMLLLVEWFGQQVKNR